MRTPTIDYCLECAEKHLQKAVIFLQESLQRQEQCETEKKCTNCCMTDTNTLEKIRKTVTELAGAEDDTDTHLEIPKIREINRRIREIRKTIWQKKLSTGKGTKDDIQKIRLELESLTNKIYEEDVAPTYNKEIENIIKDFSKSPEGETEPDWTKILEVQEEEEQQKEKKPPKKTMSQLVKEASKLTPEEEAEAYHKDLVSKYTRVYSPSETNEE